LLDILVQSRRNKAAAKKFFRKLLRGCQYVPRVIITDKLASYGAAKRDILLGVEHRQHKRWNNRAELSHQPTRQRARTMRASSRRAMPNAFSQPTAPFETIAVPVDIACKRTPTTRTAIGDSW